MPDSRDANVDHATSAAVRLASYRLVPSETKTRTKTRAAVVPSARVADGLNPVPKVIVLATVVDCRRMTVRVLPAAGTVDVRVAVADGVTLTTSFVASASAVAAPRSAYTGDQAGPV